MPYSTKESAQSGWEFDCKGKVDLHRICYENDD